MPICFMYCPTVRSEMIFQTRSSPIWFSLNARLLHQKMCYLLSWLNRRVPNGTPDCLMIRKFSLMYGIFIFDFFNTIFIFVFHMNYICSSPCYITLSSNFVTNSSVENICISFCTYYDYWNFSYHGQQLFSRHSWQHQIQ